MPTGFIASQRSWKSPARSSPRWSSASWSGIRPRHRNGLTQIGRTSSLLGSRRLWRKFDADRQLVQPADLRVDPGARTRSSFLRFRIAGDQAEFRAITFGPFKIVETRPVISPEKRNSTLYIATHRRRAREPNFCTDHDCEYCMHIYHHVISQPLWPPAYQD